MKQNYFFKAVLLLINLTINAQSYAPPAGEDGTTAIHRDDNVFISWATGATIVRGPQDITNPTGPYANVGVAENAIGKSNGQIVSLGDGGIATLTFSEPITNNDGFDFAVFENGFSNTFLELGFVEVSSNGTDFFRFPSHSQTQTSTQVGGFGSIDATYINNFAGKYRANYGTPFNLDDITDNALLNKNAITHVRIIDVIGTINPEYATYDSYGNIVNDPYATPFGSSGFDLDAVGVINDMTLSIKYNVNKNALKLYPNPAISTFQIPDIGVLEIYTISGQLILRKHLKFKQTPVQINQLHAGVYMVKLINAKGVFSQKLIKK